MANPTQTTPKGNVISNISWSFKLNCQVGILTLPTGEKKPVWRGGYEAWGKGWSYQ